MTTVAVLIITVLVSSDVVGHCMGLHQGANRYRRAQCRSNQYWAHGLCEPCPTCDPGWSLNTACGYGNPLPEMPRCESCAEGGYSGGGLQHLCRSCSDCAFLNRHTVTQCHVTQNTKCGNCLSGFADIHRDSLNPQTLICASCEFYANDPDCVGHSPDDGEPNYAGVWESPKWKVNVGCYGVIVLAVFVIGLFVRVFILWWRKAPSKPVNAKGCVKSRFPNQMTNHVSSARVVAKSGLSSSTEETEKLCANNAENELRAGVAESMELRNVRSSQVAAKSGMNVTAHDTEELFDDIASHDVSAGDDESMDMPTQETSPYNTPSVPSSMLQDPRLETHLCEENPNMNQFFKGHFAQNNGVMPV